MLGTSKKGKNLKFEDLKIFENLEICSIENNFLLEANKVSVWGWEKNFGHLRICEICLLRYQLEGLDNLEQFSFLTQEKISSELNVCFQSAGFQGGLYSKVVM